MYLKLNVLSQESRLPLHLPHKSCLWGRLGSTWRCVTAQEQRALLHVWKEKMGSFSCETWAILIYRASQKRAYMTCDVLNTVWVEVLLAFPTVLLEVNLKFTTFQLGQVLCHSSFKVHRFLPPRQYNLEKLGMVDNFSLRSPSFTWSMDKYFPNSVCFTHKG